MKKHDEKCFGDKMALRRVCLVQEVMGEFQQAQG
jgi:hypothetical protein